MLALPCLLYAMDLTVLNLAVPKLSVALRPTSTELLWIVDIYGFVRGFRFRSPRFASSKARVS